MSPSEAAAEAGPPVTPASEAVAWPSPGRSWFMVAMLFAAYTLAFVDRQILSLMIEPIKRDLHISDIQFSLLTGFAFSFFYTLMGVPLAWFADRWSRRNLVAVSIFAWSVMAALCGMARSFPALFAARMGVGVGEAGLSPAAYSMISDSFPPERRGRAIALYSLGGHVGLASAFLIGGAIAHWAAQAGVIALPGGIALRGWQLTFLVVSIPGPLLALLFLFVREPSRKELRRSEGADSALWGSFFRSNWRLLTLLCVGYALITSNLIIYLTWSPAFFGRSFGWTPAQFGATFRLILFIVGSIGLIGGGALADRLRRKGHLDAVLLVAILAAVLGYPFAVLAPLMPSPTASMALIGAMLLAVTMVPGVAALSFQMIAPNALRGRTAAAYMLVGHLISSALVPTIVAAIASHVLGDEKRIGVAMAIVISICLPAGVCCLASARKAFRATQA